MGEEKRVETVEVPTKEALDTLRTDLERLRSDLKSDLDALRTEVTKLGNKITEIGDSTSKLGSDLEALRGEVALKTDLDSLTDKVRDLRNWADTLLKNLYKYLRLKVPEE